MPIPNTVTVDQEVIRKGAHALGYLYDLLFGEVCAPEDRPHYLEVGREVALEAIVLLSVHDTPGERTGKAYRARARALAERIRDAVA